MRVSLSQQLGLVLLGALAVSCTQQPQPRTTVVANPPECPAHEEVRISLVGPKSPIPEFHDCQRLAIPGDAGLTYGPLVAVFAALDDVGSAAERDFVVMALLQSFDGPYPPLGIEEGFNCLYIRIRGVHIDAVMRPVSSHTVCATERRLGETDLAPLGTPLFGVVTRPVGRDPVDYPPVARWDFDPIASLNYIGLACVRDGWCEIFAKGSTDRPSRAWPPTRPGASHQGDRVSMVKGWYDQQLLALTSTVEGGPMSAVTGLLYPVRNLGELEEADFVGDWVPAAKAIISVSSAKYLTNLNFRGTALGHVEEAVGNDIALCTGTKRECEIPDDYDIDCASFVDGGEWWARITSAKSVGGGNPTVEYRCVDRHKHPDGFDIPGVVRWRWDVNDEKAWIRCGFGCCSIEPN